jgi:hypothetical protein
MIEWIETAVGVGEPMMFIPGHVYSITVHANRSCGSIPTSHNVEAMTDVSVSEIETPYGCIKSIRGTYTGPPQPVDMPTPDAQDGMRQEKVTRVIVKDETDNKVFWDISAKPSSSSKKSNAMPVVIGLAVLGALAVVLF